MGKLFKLFYSLVEMVRGDFFAIMAGKDRDNHLFMTLQGKHKRQHYNHVIAGVEGRFVCDKLGPEWTTTKPDHRGRQVYNGIKVYTKSAYRQVVGKLANNLLGQIELFQTVEGVRLLINGHPVWFTKSGNLLYKTVDNTDRTLMVFGPFVSEQPHDNSYTFWGPYYWTWHVYYYNGSELRFMRSFDYIEKDTQDGQFFNPNRFYFDLERWINQGATDNADWLRDRFLGYQEIEHTPPEGMLIQQVRLCNSSEADEGWHLLITTQDGQTHTVEQRELFVIKDIGADALLFNSVGGIVTPRLSDLWACCSEDSESPELVRRTIEQATDRQQGIRRTRILSVDYKNGKFILNTDFYDKAFECERIGMCLDSLLEDLWVYTGAPNVVRFPSYEVRDKCFTRAAKIALGMI